MFKINDQHLSILTNISCRISYLQTLLDLPREDVGNNSFQTLVTLALAIFDYVAGFADHFVLPEGCHIGSLVLYQWR